MKNNSEPMTSDRTAANDELFASVALTAAPARVDRRAGWDAFEVWRTRIREIQRQRNAQTR